MTNASFGDIIFFKPVSLKSRIISIIDRGSWSHVALVLGMYEGRVLFVESDWDGVKVGMLVETLDNFEIVKAPQKMEKEKQEILKFVGRKYDFRHLFFTGVHILSRKLIPLPATDEEKFICSELVNWVYGYALSEKGKATPNSIYRHLKKRKFIA